MRKPMRLLLTCEHGGNRVPGRYRRLFRNGRRLLDGHRGYDLGALALARRLAAALRCPLIASMTTRLLVDPNRHSSNRSVFSEKTRGLNPSEKARILEDYHEPHRNRVRARVEESVAAGNRVLHIAVHSFTPRLRGVERNADVGLLYDPARSGEQTFCELWQTALTASASPLRVRRNYPYRGTSDGLPTWLRTMLTGDSYWGIELEVNQRLLARRRDSEQVNAALLASLKAALALLPSSRGNRTRSTV